MKYFENLPVVDVNNQEYRNLFRRVVVDYVKDDQLINYKIKDYETLPSIAYNLYGSPEYWWVIALLNNIHDINFDTPLPTEQLEYISLELATNYTFSNALLQTGQILLSAGSQSIDINFRNDSLDKYVVMITPNIDTSDLIELGDYGYEQINPTTFRLRISNILTSNIYFTYAIFVEPEQNSTINTSEYTQYFEELVSEADAKRTIRLIKSQDIGQFITNFILELQGKELISATKADKIFYKDRINFLKKYPQKVTPEHGIVFDLDNEQFNGSSFKELDIQKHDYDNHIYVMPKPTEAELGNLGAVGVKYNFLKPRVFKTGEANSEFDYLIISPENKNFSPNNEILESGIDYFSGNGFETIITIPDNDSIFTENDIGVMITPIVDTFLNLGDIGNFSFVAIDKNTFKVINTGNDQSRFFWSVYLSNYSPFFQRFAGSNQFIALNTGISTTNFSRISILVSPVYSNENNLGNNGVIGFNVKNQTEVNVINSGTSGQQFLYKIFIDGEYSDISSDGSLVDVTIADDPNIITSEDINLLVIPTASNTTTLSDIGAFGMKLIDKNNVQLYSTGNGVLRYYVIRDYVEHGIDTFAGNGSYVTINISPSVDISHSSNIALMITPIIDDIDDLPNIGEYAYRAISTTEIRVYNTGLAGNRFKWCVVRADNI
jgi:hypothetical protein